MITTTTASIKILKKYLDNETFNQTFGSPDSINMIYVHCTFVYQKP